jgi:hypothetical protein
MVRIGVVPKDGEPSHLRGAMNLVREVDSVPGYRSSFAGMLDLNQGNAGCDLILRSLVEKLFTRRPISAMRRRPGQPSHRESDGADRRSAGEATPQTGARETRPC